MNKPNWNNLFRSTCPLCESRLLARRKGRECSNTRPDRTENCTFFITEKKYDEVRENLKIKRRIA